MSLDAMKLALAALEDVTKEHGYARGTTLFAITVLRAAIKQAQEPVALETVYDTIIQWYENDGKCSRRELARRIVALYTAPRQWQGLADEEIEQMMDYWSEPARSAYGGAHTANGEYVCIADIIRDAEKRLKEKNT